MYTKCDIYESVECVFSGVEEKMKPKKSYSTYMCAVWFVPNNLLCGAVQDKLSYFSGNRCLWVYRISSGPWLSVPGPGSWGTRLQLPPVCGVWRPGRRSDGALWCNRRVHRPRTDGDECPMKDVDTPRMSNQSRRRGAVPSSSELRHAQTAGRWQKKKKKLKKCRPGQRRRSAAGLKPFTADLAFNDVAAGASGLRTEPRGAPRACLHLSLRAGRWVRAASVHGSCSFCRGCWNPPHKAAAAAAVRSGSALNSASWSSTAAAAAAVQQNGFFLFNQNEPASIAWRTGKVAANYGTKRADRCPCGL